MTRSDEPLFDPRIADWLEADPQRAPDQALDVVLAAFPSIKQRHAWRAPWRYANVSAPMKPALVAATVVVTVLGGAWLLGRQPSPSGVGGPPTSPPTPSASPSAASPSLDTSTWNTYESARYGFTISYPDDWTERPAERDWTFEADAADWQSPGQDSFISGAGDVRVSAWSLAVAPGTSAEAWILAYCEAATEPPTDCSAIVNGAIPISVEARDQHSGLLLRSPTWDMQAFVLKADRMYVVAIWRGEADPQVRPYGGARRLLESFLSTMVLGPGAS